MNAPLYTETELIILRAAANLASECRQRVNAQQWYTNTSPVDVLHLGEANGRGDAACTAMQHFLSWCELIAPKEDPAALVAVPDEDDTPTESGPA